MSKAALLRALGALALLVSSSCANGTEDSGTTPRDTRRTADLERLGYFVYTPPDRLAQARDQVAQSAFPYFDESSGRFYFADGEDLAEGGVGRFLSDLQPVLSKAGVTLGSIEEDFGDQYAITVGGERHVIWVKSEWRNARGLGPVRAFALVNLLLERAGSRERLYAVHGDNDMVAVLLTPELLDYINKADDTHPMSKPYLPNDTPPWYGHPHD